MRTAFISVKLCSEKVSFRVKVWVTNFAFYPMVSFVLGVEVDSLFHLLDDNF